MHVMKERVLPATGSQVVTSARSNCLNQHPSDTKPAGNHREVLTEKYMWSASYLNQSKKLNEIDQHVTHTYMFLD